MCLNHPDPKPTRSYGVGYKAVRKREDGTYECYDHSPHEGSVRYPLNEWITDPNEGEVVGYGYYSSTYPAGFHIMLSSLKAYSVLRISRVEGVKIIKVRFRQVTATQTETIDSTYGPQVVARQVMNLGEV